MEYITSASLTQSATSGGDGNTAIVHHCFFHHHSYTIIVFLLCYATLSVSHRVPQNKFFGTLFDTVAITDNPI